MIGITENTKYTFLMDKKEVIKAMRILSNERLQYSSSYNLNTSTGAKLNVPYQNKEKVKELLLCNNIKFD